MGSQRSHPLAHLLTRRGALHLPARCCRRCVLQVRHLLKLSPEKWDEVSQHALAAVVPDFRPRVWWCPPIRAGVLFCCKNGAVVMDPPIGVYRGGEGGAGY